jgi:hypothetical protein
MGQPDRRPDREVEQGLSVLSTTISQAALMEYARPLKAWCVLLLLKEQELIPSSRAERHQEVSLTQEHGSCQQKTTRPTR